MKDIKRRKKLIEVAIPLEAINEASIREKSLRHGHPSTLHLWWARRPLAAARAILFCQLVDDPSSITEEFPTKDLQEKERDRLFSLIKELIIWENTKNEEVLKRARKEIIKSWERSCSDNENHKEANKIFNKNILPIFHDPFAGGGSIPLEAQRLGLEAKASDLNPIAVLINKALIEIPVKFKGFPPINNANNQNYLIQNNNYEGAQGLAEDIIFYGKMLRDEAEKRIGHLYPKAKITDEILYKRPDLSNYKNKELTIIAWLWARTIICNNPACRKETPLITTFVLSSKKGQERYLWPEINNNNFNFRVSEKPHPKYEDPTKGLKRGKSGIFECIHCKSINTRDEIAKFAINKGLGSVMTAVVAQGKKERIFLDAKISPVPKELKKTGLEIDLKLAENPRDVWCRNFGIKKASEIFTNRQLSTLNVFSEIISEISEKVLKDFDSYQNQIKDEKTKLLLSGKKLDYAEGIKLYLSFAKDKAAELNTSLCTWSPIATKLHISSTFGRQTIPMAWDYAEGNFFANSSGNIERMSTLIAEVIRMNGATSNAKGNAYQANASLTTQKEQNLFVYSTDPPYYDNIGYADLSDFFYPLIKKDCQDIYPKLFGTLTTPKKEELVALSYRHKNKDEAESFFMQNMSFALKNISKNNHSIYPITIYYAFKQSESKGSQGKVSTGWETFLEAIINSRLAVVGSWPVRTERTGGLRTKGKNSLASSIVLVCQERDTNAITITRKEFRQKLSNKIPKFLSRLENFGIAPVDIAQAAIGPGMEIYSQSKFVLKPDDSKMSVREALIEINSALDEYLSKDDLELDIDTRFALTFFKSFGYSERPFGDAEGLAKARNVSVEGIVRAGILKSVGGKVNLITRKNLPQDWDPLKDDRLCIWEATQYLIRTLEIEGEVAASKLLNTLKNISGLGDLSTSCRSLAFALYNHCEKNNQFEEARSYNNLITSWQEIEKLSADKNNESKIQTNLF